MVKIFVSLHTEYRVHKIVQKLNIDSPFLLRAENLLSDSDLVGDGVENLDAESMVGDDGPLLDRVCKKGNVER